MSDDKGLSKSNATDVFDDNVNGDHNVINAADNDADGLNFVENVPRSATDTDDEYDLSEDNLNDFGPYNSEGNHSKNISGSLKDHSKYFFDNLLRAMDTEGLDKTLSVQSKISGNLNYKNQIIHQRRKDLIDRLDSIKALYRANFQLRSSSSKGSMTRVQKLRNDIEEIEKRVDKLKHGSKSAFNIFKSKDVGGVFQQFPIEYNQARDKILERQVEE